MNIGSGRGTTIREVVETLRSFIDFDYLFDTDKPSGAPLRVMDIAMAREKLAFAPAVELAEGLQRTWQWFVSHPREYEGRLNYFLG